MRRLIRGFILTVCSLILFGACQNNIPEEYDSNFLIDISSDNFFETTSPVESFEDKIDRYIDISSGDYRYSIEDTYDLKKSLIGKYISVDGLDYYFEIKENEAILHKDFAKYAGFEPNGETEMQVVYIDKTDGVLRLLFVHKYFNIDYLNAVEFIYTEEENQFVWCTSNGMYHFQRKTKT